MTVVQDCSPSTKNLGKSGKNANKLGRNWLNKLLRAKMRLNKLYLFWGINYKHKKVK